MIPASSSDIKKLLAQYGTSPSKTMGQNFLIDAKALRNIVESAALTKQDTVLEVGPGMGILTKELAERTKEVIAVEKDRSMVQILQDILKDARNIEIIQADILRLPEEKIPRGEYKLVANIPYYLTSALIRTFLEHEHPPTSMSLMIQKEVAQRICAKAPDMSLLAVSVQLYAKPTIISYVKKESFWPKPNVDSAIIKIEGIRRPKDIDVKKFFKLAKAGFAQPRKQLLNNLSRYLRQDRSHVASILKQCGIQPEQRAETLTLENWMKLTNSF